MTPEVGKTYRSRNGEKSVVTGKHGMSPGGDYYAYRFYGWVYSTGAWRAQSWTVTGGGLASGRVCDDDLVGEWREPATWVLEVVIVKYPDGSIQSHVGLVGTNWAQQVIARRTITLTEGEGV